MMKKILIASFCLFFVMLALETDCLQGFFDMLSGDDEFTRYGILGTLSQIGARRRARKEAKNTFNRVNKLADKTIAADEKAYAGEFDAMRGLSDQVGGMLDNSLGRSVLDTTEGKSTLAALDNRSDKSRTRLGNDANMMGLSSEAYLSGLGNINESEAGAITDSLGALTTNKNNKEMGLLGMKSGVLSNIFGARKSVRDTARGFGAGTYQNVLSGIQQRQAQNAASLNEFSSQALKAGIGG